MSFFSDAYGAMVSRRSTARLEELIVELRSITEGKGRQVRAELGARARSLRDEARLPVEAPLRTQARLPACIVDPHNPDAMRHGTQCECGMF